MIVSSVGIGCKLELRFSRDVGETAETYALEQPS